MKTTKRIKITRKQLLDNLEKLKSPIKNYESNHVFFEKYIYTGETYHDISKNMTFLSKKEALKTLSNINKKLIKGGKYGNSAQFIYLKYKKEWSF